MSSICPYCDQDLMDCPCPHDLIKRLGDDLTASQERVRELESGGVLEADKVTLAFFQKYLDKPDATLEELCREIIDLKDREKAVREELTELSKFRCQHHASESSTTTCCHDKRCFVCWSEYKRGFDEGFSNGQVSEEGKEVVELEAERDAAQKELEEANEKLARLSHIIWLHHEVGFIQKMAKTIGGCYICMENKTFNDAPNQHKLSHKEEVEELRKESDEYLAQWIKTNEYAMNLSAENLLISSKLSDCLTFMESAIKYFEDGISPIGTPWFEGFKKIVIR